MSASTKCLIVDDEPLAIELIKDHIERIPQLEILATCQNALEAFDILKKEPVDLVFLDIQMPVLTGMEFVKSLQHPPSIIFTTAYRQYAVESYELDVIDYLLKPITFTRFFKAINKYFNSQQTAKTVSIPHSNAPSPEDFIYVNANKKHIKVSFADILFVESIKDYVRIHTPEKNIVTKDKISDFADKLPGHFLRVHRSYIVNTSKISAFTAHDIEIGTHEIPIGISYKQQVFDFFRNHQKIKPPFR